MSEHLHQAFQGKGSRISMRVDPLRKAAISRAAKIQHTSISGFILDNAYKAANQIIADETHITMSQGQFEHLCQLLDNPPTENLKKMQQFLNTRTILDE